MNQNNNDNNQTIAQDFITVEEPRLVVLDLVSIALAAQFLGLMDVLQDATFWQKGGFLQPIPLAPSTLPIYVQRESILSICWVLSGLAWRGYQTEAALSDPEATVKLTVRIATIFVVLRVALAGIVVWSTGTNIDAFDIFRQCYVSILTAGSFRFLYSQFTYNR